MRKICVSILSIICATNAFAAPDANNCVTKSGSNYKYCECDPNDSDFGDVYCNKNFIYKPAHTKTMKCSSVTKTCVSDACENNYEAKNGYCQKISSASSVQTTQQTDYLNANKSITITCDYSSGNKLCSLMTGHNLTLINANTNITKDPFDPANILYMESSNTNTSIRNFIQSTKCPYVETVLVDNDNYYVLYCTTNSNVTVTNKNDPTNSWSYTQKKCVGSGGKWENNACNCSLLSGTQERDNECICNNPKQKYYNKNLTGCKTLSDTSTSVNGGLLLLLSNSSNASLSQWDKWNSCEITGGKWSGKITNQCSCSPALNMEQDNSAYFCNCKSGYDYKNPLFKKEGCALPENIKGYYSDDNRLNNKPLLGEQECPKSGGIWDNTNNTCRCSGDDVKDNLHPNPVTQTVTGNDNQTLTYSVCRCANGYKRANDNYTDECVDANETETKKVLDTEAMRQQAEEAYQAARDHEQSWENKALTAGTTLATGEGAMAATQAYFEQRADADAERDMAAYLATFKCEYGGGKTFNAGNEEIFLPGGNELLNYYSEYKTLADSVKQTKTALGLRSGIESDVLYDRAQSGLYQYANAEQTSGGEISLSRALQNPEGIDAEKWNTQKAQTAQNLKTGITAVAGGVAGGIVGNHLINKDWKPSPLIAELKPVITRIANEHPQTFKPVVEDPTSTPEQPTPQQFTTIYRELQNGTFISGSLELTNETKSDLDALVTAIKELLDEPEHRKAELKIYVDAYTDGQSLGQDTKNRLQVRDNDELSQARADAILKQLRDSFVGSTIKYEAKGHGVHQNCLDKNGEAIDEANDECRKLSITVKDEHVYTNDQ